MREKESKMENETIDTLETRILNSVNSGLEKAIAQELVGYDKPLSKLTSRVLEDNSDALYGLINREFSVLLNGEGFRLALKQALNKKLAQTLIDRMGGELEKQVNKLKSNLQRLGRLPLNLLCSQG